MRARIRERPNAPEPDAHQLRVVTTNDRAIATFFDQGAVRHAGAILEANARALFERGEHAHVVDHGAQIGERLIDLTERVRGRAAHPTCIREHVHLIALRKQHDALGARVEEANHAARLPIGARAPAEPRAHGVERRLGRLGRVVQGQRNAARHASTLAPQAQKERNPRRPKEWPCGQREVREPKLDAKTRNARLLGHRPAGVRGATFTRKWRAETGNELGSAFFETSAWQAFLGSVSHCVGTAYTHFCFACKLPAAWPAAGLLT